MGLGTCTAGWRHLGGLNARAARMPPYAPTGAGPPSAPCHAGCSARPPAHALAPGRVPPTSPSYTELVGSSAQPKRSTPATLVALLARPTPGSAAALVHPRLALLALTLAASRRPRAGPARRSLPGAQLALAASTGPLPPGPAPVGLGSRLQLRLRHGTGLARREGTHGGASLAGSQAAPGGLAPASSGEPASKGRAPGPGAASGGGCVAEIREARRRAAVPCAELTSQSRDDGRAPVSGRRASSASGGAVGSGGGASSGSGDALGGGSRSGGGHEGATGLSPAATAAALGAEPVGDAREGGLPRVSSRRTTGAFGGGASGGGGVLGGGSSGSGGSGSGPQRPAKRARSAQPGGQRRGSGDRVYSSRYKGARASRGSGALGCHRFNRTARVAAWGGGPGGPLLDKACTVRVAVGVWA